MVDGLARVWAQLREQRTYQGGGGNSVQDGLRCFYVLGLFVFIILK